MSRLRSFKSRTLYPFVTGCIGHNMSSSRGPLGSGEDLCNDCGGVFEWEDETSEWVCQICGVVNEEILRPSINSSHPPINRSESIMRNSHRLSPRLQRLNDQILSKKSNIRQGQPFFDEHLRSQLMFEFQCHNMNDTRMKRCQELWLAVRSWEESHASSTGLSRKGNKKRKRFNTRGRDSIAIRQAVYAYALRTCITRDQRPFSEQQRSPRNRFTTKRGSVDLVTARAYLIRLSHQSESPAGSFMNKSSEASLERLIKNIFGIINSIFQDTWVPMDTTTSRTSHISRIKQMNITRRNRFKTHHHAVMHAVNQQVDDQSFFLIFKLLLDHPKYPLPTQANAMRCCHAEILYQHLMIEVELSIARHHVHNAICVADNIEPQQLNHRPWRALAIDVIHRLKGESNE